MSDNSPHWATVKDLQRRQVISREIAERLAILPSDRLGLTLATLIIDIPNLHVEHVNELLSAETDADFSAALRNVKRRISIPTADLYAQLCYLSLIRFIGVAENTIKTDDEDADRLVRFAVDKILRTVWVTLSLLSKREGNEAAAKHLKRFRNTILDETF